MGVWRPNLPRRMVILDLHYGDTPNYRYQLQGPEISAFPEGTPAEMVFKNSYGEVVGTWDGSVVGGYVELNAESDDADKIPRASTFTLTVFDASGRARQPIWGHVTRNEARYPDSPDSTTEFVAVQYVYDFGTPGRVVDNSWQIKNGAPTVWDNSGSGLPNGVACGILFDDAAMLWAGEFRGDSIDLNWSIVNGGAGKSGIAICSDYDMTNYLAVVHETGLFNNKLHIETGTGPVTTISRANVAHASANNNNYTARYNFLTNTISVYLGTNLATPLITWEDETNIVDHGAGERYYGMNWRASLLSPGVQFTGIRAQDAA